MVFETTVGISLIPNVPRLAGPRLHVPGLGPLAGLGSLGAAAPPGVLPRILEILRSVTQQLDGDPPPRSTRTGPGSTTLKPEASLSMEQLVHDHADAVYRVALSVTRNPVLAEDASQDTMIKAWQSLPSYRGDAPLRHWILRIAHNTSVSLVRKRREHIMSPLDMPESASAPDSVEVQVEDRLAVARFEKALDLLDSTSRSIVVLREVEGLAYAEISDVLDLPLPTVRTRLLRARRQLAAALDGWQP